MSNNRVKQFSSVQQQKEKKTKQILDSLLAKITGEQSWTDLSVSAGPGQQNEFFHPVIPNIRNIHDSRGKGIERKSRVPAFPRSRVYNAGEEFVSKHREWLQRNITGARVVSCKFTFLLPRCFATFSYSSPSLLLLLLFFLLFISFDREPDGRSAADTASYRKTGAVIEFI